MKLYYSPGACSLSPHIVATEAGVPVELEKVDLAKHTTENGHDFMAINPKGYVPTLRLDAGHHPVQRLFDAGAFVVRRNDDAQIRMSHQPAKTLSTDLLDGMLEAWTPARHS